MKNDNGDPHMTIEKVSSIISQMNDSEAAALIPQGLQHNHHKEYNPYKMPCNWNLAADHARSRRTAPEKQRDIDHIQEVTVCPCCGYDLEREEIPYCSNPISLAFLGSGYALFYNYLKYCIIILFIQIVVQQAYNLYSNYHGTYCYKIPGQEAASECYDSIMLHLSIANKIDQPEEVRFVHYLNFVSLFIIMGVLLYFRKSQREIDIAIDESQLSPADYTIKVMNIPKHLKVNYTEKLTEIFEKQILPEQEIIVRKVVSVYNIDQFLKLEEELAELIVKKKHFLKENDYHYENDKVRAIDNEIELLEEHIEEEQENCRRNPHKFRGIAFISFENETMKNLIIEKTSKTRQRIEDFLYHGLQPDVEDGDVTWEHHILFIEQAPEPNEIDWEFIHIKQKEKQKSRIQAWIGYLIFEIVTFVIVFLLSLRLAKHIEDIHEEAEKGDVTEKMEEESKVFSFLISVLIVVFNKFCVGKVIHYIVDYEKFTNKTSFQIAYVYKFASALFINAAILSYMIDFVILNNIIGYAGFIQNETQIFILNAFFGPIIWAIDPWSLAKNIKRYFVVKQGKKALYTQKEANQLFEQPDYLSAKRYSDIMKTMWFTFLFGTAIPIGTFFSFFGLILYYYIDYYNLLRRRTIKESISIKLSTEMIELLEMIIVFSALGNLVVYYQLLNMISWSDILLLVIAIIYSNLPMEKYSQKLFPTYNNEEPKPYHEGEIFFETNYDIENPILHKHAFASFQAAKHAHIQDYRSRASKHSMNIKH